MHMSADLRNVVREVVLTIDKGGPEEAKAEVERLRGLIPVGMPHRGKKNMTEQEVIEWYAGEIVDIVDNQAWFAMNSIINCLDKFCPEKV
jgi:hypothetical protein